MWKWLGRGLLLVVLAGAGIFAYDYYRFVLRAGLHKMPDLPEGAFWVSFKGGFRGIVIDADDVRPARRYLAYEAEDVPTWFEETWSTCRPLTDDERQAFEEEAGRSPGLRWEAICEIDADGETVIRGWLASVPDS